MNKTYRYLNEIGKLSNKSVVTEQDIEDIHLCCIARENTTQFKIAPGSKYESMACHLLEEGNKERLVADLVSVAMLDDGKNETVSHSAIVSMINRLNPIENVVKTKGQWSDLHEAWVIARYNFTLHMLVRMDETFDNPSVQKHVQGFRSLPDWLNRENLEKEGYTFSMKQVSWFDECHVYQKVGPGLNSQY